MVFINLKIINIILITINYILINSLKIENIIKHSENKKLSNFKEKYHLKDSEEDIFEIADYERIDPKDPNYFYLPIFGSSDIHGHFYEEQYEVGNLTYSQAGLDYMAKYINIIKDEFENNYLYVDAGDLFQGGAESTLSNGEIILDYFNAINLNATTFGNHEYDYSREFLENKIKNAKFPFLATNIYDTNRKTKKVFGDNHLTSKVYTIQIPNLNNKTLEDEIKVGIVGLSMEMYEDQISGSGFEGIKFLDYKEELISESKYLRNEEGVNAVILLCHIGIGCGQGNNLTLNMYKPSDEQEECSHDSDLYKIINEIDEGTIDAVITGHSHRQVHHFIKGIPVISPINFGYYANIIYLAFDRNNNYKIVKKENRIEGSLPICEKIFKKNLQCEFITENELKDYLPLINYSFHNVKIEKDPILKPVHDKYDEEYNKQNEKICTIIGTKNLLTVEKNGSFYLGNIKTDMDRIISGADISIVSFGSLRTTWNPGKLPRYKVNDLLPFGNYLCTYNMNGTEVKKMLKIIQTGEKKKYYLTSGIKQTMVKNKEYGDYYLSNIKLFDGDKESEIIPDHEYLIASNDYLINGGDDFNKVITWYKPKNLNCEYGDEADLMIDFLKAQKTIDVRKYMDDNNPRIRFIE